MAIVAHRNDSLAVELERQLQSLQLARIWLDPKILSEQQATLDSEGLEIMGCRISAVFWRVRPDSHFSSNYEEVDQSFVDVETRAFWLSALNYGKLATTFSPEASAFFTGSGWMLWRKHLIKGNVNVSPLGYGVEKEGGEWLPYLYSTVRPAAGSFSDKALGAAVLNRAQGGFAILAGTKVIDSATENDCFNPNILAAASVLREVGLQFAEIGLDSENAVLTVNPFPDLKKSSLIISVAESLVRILYVPFNSR